MRILITGATGVIGRRVVPALRARGHEITAVGRGAARLTTLAQPGVATLALDLFDPPAVRHALRGHDAVINLATHVPPNSRAFLPGAWRQMDRVRREGSAIIADAATAVGARRYVQESFAPIYPDGGANWVTEATPPRPASYNRSVLDAEASAMRFAAGGGAAVILRFAFFYGPNDAFSDQLIAMARAGWLPLLGRPDAYFPMVTHDDAAAAVVAAVEAPAGTYNVVDDQPFTHRAIADALGRILVTRPPRLLPAWVARLGGSLGETLARSLRVSNAKLKGATGWTPSVPNVEDGLRRVAAALR
jgi:nucleoside-diphosphate-sugar epimerase